MELIVYVDVMSGHNCAIRSMMITRLFLHVVKADVSVHAIEGDFGGLTVWDLQPEGATLAPLVSENHGLEACIAIPVRYAGVVEVGCNIEPAVAPVVVGILGNEDLETWLFVGAGNRADSESSHCVAFVALWVDGTSSRVHD